MVRTDHTPVSISGILWHGYFPTRTIRFVNTPPGILLQPSYFLCCETRKSNNLFNRLSFRFHLTGDFYFALGFALGFALIVCNSPRFGAKSARFLCKTES